MPPKSNARRGGRRGALATDGGPGRTGVCEATRTLLLHSGPLAEMENGKEWEVRNQNLRCVPLEGRLCLGACGPVKSWTRIAYRVRFSGNQALPEMMFAFHFNKHRVSNHDMTSMLSQWKRKILVAWKWSDIEKLTDMWAPCRATGDSPGGPEIFVHFNERHLTHFPSAAFPHGPTQTPDEYFGNRSQSPGKLAPEALPAEAEAVSAAQRLPTPKRARLDQDDGAVAVKSELSEPMSPVLPPELHRKPRGSVGLSQSSASGLSQSSAVGLSHSSAVGQQSSHGDDREEASSSAVGQSSHGASAVGQSSHGDDREEASSPALGQSSHAVARPPWNRKETPLGARPSSSHQAIQTSPLRRNIVREIWEAGGALGNRLPVDRADRSRSPIQRWKRAWIAPPMEDVSRHRGQERSHEGSRRRRDGSRRRD